MAKKHFLVPSRLVNRLPFLRRFVWMVEAAAVKSLIGLCRLLPPERAYSSAHFLFSKLKPLLPFAGKIRRNLRIAFPDKTTQEIERLTRAICGNLGKAAVDLSQARRVWAERDRRLEVVLEKGVDLAKYRNRPAVMVGAHIGAWQFGLFFATLNRLEITSVFAPEQNPYLRDYFVKLRGELGPHFVSRDGCMRHLSKELKQGRLVGLIADTRLDAGEPVPFFGTNFMANTSPARLALRYRCDLIPVRVERLEGCRFRVTLFPPVSPAEPQAPDAEQARQMTAEVFRQFEAWIRADPAQWMCFSRRWPAEAYED